MYHDLKRRLNPIFPLSCKSKHIQIAKHIFIYQKYLSKIGELTAKMNYTRVIVVSTVGLSRLKTNPVSVEKATVVQQITIHDGL